MPLPLSTFRPTRALAALLAALLLAACTSQAPSEPAPEPPVVGRTPVDAEAVCDADAVAHAIGASFDEALVEALRDESGSRHVRVLRPDSAATMDYREDRLNIVLGSDELIEAVRCG